MSYSITSLLSGKDHIKFVHMTARRQYGGQITMDPQLALCRHGNVLIAVDGGALSEAWVVVQGEGKGCDMLSVVSVGFKQRLIPETWQP